MSGRQTVVYCSFFLPSQRKFHSNPAEVPLKSLLNRIQNLPGLRKKLAGFAPETHRVSDKKPWSFH